MSYGVAEKVAGLLVSDTGEGKVRRTVFSFTDCVLPLVDNAGVAAHAEQKLYTFPEAYNLFQTVGVNLSLTRTSTGVNADFDGDFGLGTAASNGDATLSGTEQDVVATTSTAQAVAGVGTAKYTSAAQALQDGTAGGKALYLNLLVDDADQDVTTTPGGLKLNGTIEFNWVIGADK